jgi:hypothetical protein
MRIAQVWCALGARRLSRQRRDELCERRMLTYADVCRYDAHSAQDAYRGRDEKSMSMSSLYSYSNDGPSEPKELPLPLAQVVCVCMYSLVSICACV